MSEPPLPSPAHDVVDAFAPNELFQERGWTDGLPVVPPTEEGVRRFFAGARLVPHLIGPRVPDGRPRHTGPVVVFSTR